jgi:long-chain acyl-CoA synthetase
VSAQSGAETPWPWGTELAEVDVLGFPCMCFSPRRTHIRDLLLDAHRFSDREYLIQGDRRISFADNEQLVRRASAVLRERGVGPGDRIMLFARNAADWVIAFWSIIDVGGVVVLGNAWWSATELVHALDITKPALVFTDEQHGAALPETQARMLLTDLQGVDTETPVAPVTPPPSAEDDAAVILFTSGTTGLPKGAVLSHRGIIATLHAILTLTRRVPAPGGEIAPPSKSLLSLPLFHIGGLQQIITPMAGGGTLVFTEGRFSPEGVVRLIEDEGISVWSTVPTMVSRVIDYLEESGHAPVEQLRTVGLGGSPVVQALRERVAQWFPNARKGLAVTYGLSEAGGVLASGAGPEVAARPGSVGKPLPISTIRIFEPDETGAGEIIVRAPSVMLGYWTKEACEPGGAVDPGPVTSERWLFTGDVGRLDQDGYLYITDRSKDIVIRGGENIASPHIESRLLEHPAVREAAVVGLPHPSLGEEVGAIVVLNPGASVSADDLAKFAAEELAYFEVPTQWRFRSETLPQNATGKILKRVVRQEWIDDLSADSPAEDL